MGFKYVFIPASINEEIEEFEFPEDVLDLTRDTFRQHVERHFAAQSQNVDREVLLKQLQERTGVDLAAQAQDANIDRLLSSTSVEIFPVQLPTKETKFRSISAYCDDKGVAKGLADNPRMNGLVNACGYPGQTFRGDVFISRVFDDTEDEWRREDFPIADLSTDAAWVKETQKQRSNKSSSDISSLANTMGMKNAHHVNSAMLQDESAKGETDQYAWRQAGEEVEVTFKTGGLQKGDKKLVKANFSRQRLKVEIKGEVFVDAQLYAPTQPDEATWTLSDGILQVTLVKADAENWPTFL